MMAQQIEVVRIEHQMLQEKYAKERPLSMMNNDAVQVQKSPLSFLSREPVAIAAAIRAGLAVAIGFGFSMSPEQLALIIVFVELVLGLITRSATTPFASSGTTPQVAQAETPELVPPQM